MNKFNHSFSPVQYIGAVKVKGRLLPVRQTNGTAGRPDAEGQKVGKLGRAGRTELFACFKKR